MRIMLIEDDQDLADAVIAGLKQNSFVVDWINEGKPLEFFSNNFDYDLIVLDLGLPNISGLKVLKSIRQAKLPIPVIVVTARDTTDDCVEALNSGADDYITKPFDLTELIARIRALSRRTLGRTDAILEYKKLKLDPVAHTVSVDDEQVYLPRREFTLLEKLLENIGKVLSREQLTNSIYNWDDEVDSNAIEVHIHSLRKKFVFLNLRTIRGIGYLLEKDKHD